jgi:SAM-dependent methyltransferase
MNPDPLPPDNGPTPPLAALLGARSLSELAELFSFSICEGRWMCERGEEPITGAEAIQYQICAREQVKRYKDFAEEIAGHLGPRKSDNLVLLDAGSGTGFLTLCLAQQLSNTHVRAIDVSGDMVKAATNLFGVQAFPIRKRAAVSLGDICNRGHILSALRGSAADVVICRNVIHRLRSPDLAMLNLLSALAPNGILILTAFASDLENEPVRDELLKNVQARLRTTNGIPLIRFAHCYLSAVLSAPVSAEYEGWLADVVRTIGWKGHRIVSYVRGYQWMLIARAPGGS